MVLFLGVGCSWYMAVVTDDHLTGLLVYRYTDSLEQQSNDGRSGFCMLYDVPIGISCNPYYNHR